VNYIFANFFLLILIGFLISHLIYKFRYDVQEDSGHILIFRSIIFGIGFHLFITFIIYIFRLIIFIYCMLVVTQDCEFKHLNPYNLITSEIENLFIEKEKLETSDKKNNGCKPNQDYLSNKASKLIGTLWVSIVFVLFYWIREKINPSLAKIAQTKVAVKKGSELEEYLASEFFKKSKKKLLEFKMLDNSVYFAFIIGVGFKPNTTNYFTILPISKGYKDNETGYIELESYVTDNSYDFNVILKVDDIVSLSPFIGKKNL